MKNMTISDFAAQTASNDPVPGGGSISALAGALSAALTEMVAGLTVGRKKYTEVEEEMKQAIPVMTKSREILLDDIKKDSESFNLYMQALTLPKNTEEEKQKRQEAMQNGLKAAVAVPFSVAEEAVKIFPYAKLMVTRGNQTAITDGLVAAMMARTAVLGALYNVKINLRSIKDEEFVTDIAQKVKQLEKKAETAEKEIREASGL